MNTTVHLLHGLPGCGKTSFARQFASDHKCVLLSHDEWVIQLFGVQPTADQLDLVRAPIFDRLWAYTERILRTDTDVILDFGFWTRRERDDARCKVLSLGAKHKLYQFACPTEVAWARVNLRNSSGSSEGIYIDRNAFLHFASLIDPLEPDEEHVTVHADASPETPPK